MIFVAGQSQPPEHTGHGGDTHPSTPTLPKRRTQLLQGGIGMFPTHQRDQLSRRRVTAGLTAARMGPWGHRPRGAAAPQQMLDQCAADAKHCRQGALRAAVAIIGSEDFLTKIEGVWFHGRPDYGLPALNAIANRSRRIAGLAHRPVPDLAATNEDSR